MVEARAVRKAVSSEALRRPVVLPWLSRRVKEPRIVDTADAAADDRAEDREAWPVLVGVSMEAAELVVLDGEEGVKGLAVDIELRGLETEL